MKVRLCHVLVVINVLNCVVCYHLPWTSTNEEQELWPRAEIVKRQLYDELSKLEPEEKEKLFFDLQNQEQAFEHTKRKYPKKYINLDEPDKSASTILDLEDEELSPLNIAEIENFQQNLRTKTKVPVVRNKRTLKFILLLLSGLMNFPLVPVVAVPAPPPPPAPPAPPAKAPAPAPPAPPGKAPATPPPTRAFDPNAIAYPFRPAPRIPLITFAPLPPGVTVPYPPQIPRPAAPARPAAKPAAPAPPRKAPSPPPAAKPAPPPPPKPAPPPPKPAPPKSPPGPTPKALTLEYDHPVKIQIYSKGKSHLPASGGIYSGDPHCCNEHSGVQYPDYGISQPQPQRNYDDVEPEYQDGVQRNQNSDYQDNNQETDYQDNNQPTDYQDNNQQTNYQDNNRQKDYQDSNQQTDYQDNNQQTDYRDYNDYHDNVQKTPPPRQDYRQEEVQDYEEGKNPNYSNEDYQYHDEENEESKMRKSKLPTQKTVTENLEHEDDKEISQLFEAEKNRLTQAPPNFPVDENEYYPFHSSHKRLSVHERSLPEIFPQHQNDHRNPISTQYNYVYPPQLTTPTKPTLQRRTSILNENEKDKLDFFTLKHKTFEPPSQKQAESYSNAPKRGQTILRDDEKDKLDFFTLKHKTFEPITQNRGLGQYSAPTTGQTILREDEKDKLDFFTLKHKTFEPQPQKQTASYSNAPGQTILREDEKDKLDFFTLKHKTFEPQPQKQTASYSNAPKTGQTILREDEKDKLDFFTLKHKTFEPQPPKQNLAYSPPQTSLPVSSHRPRPPQAVLPGNQEGLELQEHSYTSSKSNPNSAYETVPHINILDQEVYKQQIEKDVEKYVEGYVEKQINDGLIDVTIPKTTVINVQPGPNSKLRSPVTTISTTQSKLLEGYSPMIEQAKRNFGQPPWALITHEGPKAGPKPLSNQELIGAPHFTNIWGG